MKYKTAFILIALMGGGIFFCCGGLVLVGIFAPSQPRPASRPPPQNPKPVDASVAKPVQEKSAPITDKKPAISEHDSLRKEAERMGGDAVENDMGAQFGKVYWRKVESADDKRWVFLGRADRKLSESNIRLDTFTLTMERQNDGKWSVVDLYWWPD